MAPASQADVLAKGTTRFHLVSLARILLANASKGAMQQGEDKPSPLLCLRSGSPGSSIVGATLVVAQQATGRPGAEAQRL